MNHLGTKLERSFAICLWVLVGLAWPGCGSSEKAAPAAHSEPRVHLTRPERRTIEHSVGQPAFVNAYEQTSIYPKISGYVKDWYVDIGDRIKKDLLLADLFVPELDAEFQQKKAQLQRDQVLVEVARQQVEVVGKQLQMAIANVAQARADVGKYQRAVERWESEVKRLGKMVDERVVDRQVLDESEKQLKSNVSARDAAVAAVSAAEATQAAQQATLEKSRVDVDAARANAKVAQTVVDRYAALVSYTQLTAPYEGVVVVRNANTGDFVQPAQGDKSIDQDNTSDLSKRQGAPIYVLARTDLVRIFVDVPEIDASHVFVGTPAKIRIQALDDVELSGAVTRTSWALNVQTRTLRAEIDLPNTDARMLPGMYAYATVLMRRADVWALPVDAIFDSGNQSYCFLLAGGKAVETPLQTGMSDGHYIEVPKKQVGGQWIALTPDDAVILGDLTNISDGQAVQVDSGKAVAPDERKQ